MAKDQGIVQTSMRRRTAFRPPATGSAARTPEEERKPRVGPFQFLREVRAEARKITWTTWKETWITSVMVGIMVLITAVFFFGVDTLLGLGVNSLLKLTNAG
jgi:preprotein translocase subunit SecE